jgi:transposase
MQVTVTVLLEQSDGQLQESTREFGTFRADRLALAEWLNSLNVEPVVMESTGIYWRSIFSTWEAAGLEAHLVNARHVKQVPGRKTDVKDSQWLASLARCGLAFAQLYPASGFAGVTTGDALSAEADTHWPVKRIASIKCLTTQGSVSVVSSATLTAPRPKR